MRKIPILGTVPSKIQTGCRRTCAATGALLLCGCSGVQSALEPHGPQARTIAQISWMMFWGAAVILLLVMALALYAIYRAPGKHLMPCANTWIVGGGVVLPVVVLSALLAYGVFTMGGLRSGAQPVGKAVQLEVVGNRWWWEVHYRDADGSIVSSANEINIPAGKPVTVSLRTNDVIHSFWVPNLAGKLDLIPGRTNYLVLQADQPGTFRGQCAEFCGAQHARMAFHVIAHAPAEYAAWFKRQRESATTPINTNLDALRGRDAFVQHCVACHTVRGVGIAEKRGPDLTHLASRAYLAAGTLLNNRDNLLAFIAHSQTIKPGSSMPSHAHLEQGTLQALASYLESLD